MRRINVALAGQQYDILIGDGLLTRLDEWIAALAPSSIAVITNATVEALYGSPAIQSLRRLGVPVSIITLPDGEEHKNWTSVSTVLDGLFAAGADRKSIVVALGGGVIGDLAGFAASIYMRGIRFVQVPTTLLAQVDSSVGGKTGINHPRGKNLIGAFHQPSVVVSDTAVLGTLPDREISAGLAEIIKHGLLADADYFEGVAASTGQIRRRETDALAAAIARSCEIKGGVVARDEREAGERALLNLGHTFGHAIESLTGFGRWLHGEAVGCGLVLAADLSRRVGLVDAQVVARVTDAVADAGLPVRIEGLGIDAALQSMQGDKKAEAGKLRFILLERIGRAVQRAVPDEALRATLVAGGYR